MATYTANVLEFAGVNQQAPVANIQRHQIGYAVDFDHLDESGKPSVVFSWNRNIHAKDLATKKNYVEPEHITPIPSAETLRLSQAKHLTKAYKDGLDYIRAEKDYREKQEFLDRITPGRPPWISPRGPAKNQVSIGTNTSTSGLPVPDDNGVVAHYPVEVTAMTGLRFSAPPGGKEHVPKPMGLGQSNGLVIRTEETEIRKDPATGLSLVNSGAGSTTPLDPMIITPDEIPMPGLYPNFPSPSSPLSHTSAKSPEVEQAPSINPDDLVIASTRKDPQEVSDILESNIIDNRFISTPARTPFRFRGRPSEALAGQKRKGTPLPRLDKKRQRREEELDEMQPLDEIAVVTNITVPGGTATRLTHKKGQQESLKIIPESLKSGVKRPAMRQPEERQIKKRTRLNDADEDIVKLEPIEKVEKQRQRKPTRNVNYTPPPGAPHPFDENPWERTAGAARNLRPIAALRGKKDIDYAMERSDPLISNVSIPTVELRRRKAGPSSTEPARKKQRII
ncbi:hypothetical protein BC832DRAFT_543012 [Gaertneriomyces semiglobifer]|nr:hypothetical protein BC832DRAFT_543012 [Gaertneriomyces semiglobifer]